MTYYRWNTKYIDHAERALAQPKLKIATASQWGISMIFAAICIYCLLTEQYALMVVSSLLGICIVWGAGDESHKKFLSETRAWYLSTITLDNDIIVLRDGNGQLEKAVRYTEIYGIEKVELPAAVEYFIPDTKIQRPRVREKISFICVYTDRCRLAPDVVFEDCWNDPRVILFPFYQSAWDILRDKQIQSIC